MPGRSEPDDKPANRQLMSGLHAKASSIMAANDPAVAQNSYSALTRAPIASFDA
jgi:hypothetical protein